MLNSNLVHNVLNVAIAVSGLGSAVLLAVGCVDIGGAYDCSASPVSPAITAAVAGALGVLKTVINVVRDGFSGLAKPQPPVKK